MSTALSGNQRCRLTVLVSTVVLAAASLITIRPMVVAYQAKLIELTQARASLPAEPHFTPTFSQLNDKLITLKNELATKRRSFPIAENVSTLLMDLETLASSQVVIRHFYPTKLAAVNLPKSRAKTGISVSEQQIEMEAVGPFAALHRVLSRFETYAHPVGIRGILLTASSGAKRGMVEQLSLKLKLSAFLMNQPPSDSTVLGELPQQIQEAQLGTGVVDPFTKVLSDPIPVAPALLAPSLPKPMIPKPSELMPKSELSKLAAWRLEGIMVGYDERAIVHKAGQLSQIIRIQESLDGWTVMAIEARAIELAKGGQRARLSLPDLLP